MVALLIAAAGYAVVAPDYLGLGAGPNQHPYLHVASEVTASVDMLRAARTFAAGRHRRLDPRILVSGFSQGGAAAMGFARALKEGADPQLRLGAVAPVSGTYDLGGAEFPAVLSGATDPLISNYNVAYLYHEAMSRIHSSAQRRTRRLQPQENAS